MKDWLKPLMAAIIGGMSGGILCLIILSIAYNNSEVFGNVADWVSGIGSLLAVVFIIWQNKEAKKNLDKQLKTEQERRFHEYRVQFKISKLDKSAADLTKLYVSAEKYDYVSENNNYKIIKVKNLSDRAALLAKIVVKTKTEQTFYFDRINGYQDKENEVDLAVYDFDEEKDVIVSVYFLTEIRERIKLVFKSIEQQPVFGFYWSPKMAPKYSDGKGNVLFFRENFRDYADYKHDEKNVSQNYVYNTIEESKIKEFKKDE